MPVQLYEQQLTQRVQLNVRGQRFESTVGILCEYCASFRFFFQTDIVSGTSVFLFVLTETDGAGKATGQQESLTDHFNRARLVADQRLMELLLHHHHHHHHHQNPPAGGKGVLGTLKESPPQLQSQPQPPWRRSSSGGKSLRGGQSSLILADSVVRSDSDGSDHGGAVLRHPKAVLAPEQHHSNLLNSPQLVRRRSLRDLRLSCDSVNMFVPSQSTRKKVVDETGNNVSPNVRSKSQPHDEEAEDHVIGAGPWGSSVPRRAALSSGGLGSAAPLRRSNASDAPTSVGPVDPSSLPAVSAVRFDKSKHMWHFVFGSRPRSSSDAGGAAAPAEARSAVREAPSLKPEYVGLVVAYLRKRWREEQTACKQKAAAALEEPQPEPQDIMTRSSMRLSMTLRKSTTSLLPRTRGASWCSLRSRRQSVNISPTRGMQRRHSMSYSRSCTALGHPAMTNGLQRSHSRSTAVGPEGTSLYGTTLQTFLERALSSVNDFPEVRLPETARERPAASTIPPPSRVRHMSGTRQPRSQSPSSLIPIRLSHVSLPAFPLRWHELPYDGQQSFATLVRVFGIELFYAKYSQPTALPPVAGDDDGGDPSCDRRSAPPLSPPTAGQSTLYHRAAGATAAPSPVECARADLAVAYAFGEAVRHLAQVPVTETTNLDFDENDRDDGDLCLRSVSPESTIGEGPPSLMATMSTTVLTQNLGVDGVSAGHPWQRPPHPSLADDNLTMATLAHCCGKCGVSGHDDATCPY